MSLVDYAGLLAQDGLLPTRLPEKIQKQRWLKPKKTHDKASKRSMTGAEAAEQAADKAERAVTRPIIPNEDNSDGDNGILVPGIPPGAPGLIAGESQGGTTITLSLRTPERLRGPPELVPTLAPEPEASPEPQVQLPASTVPARMEEGAWKRPLIANKRYTDSQYEL
jgi:hypothetical protein